MQTGENDIFLPLEWGPIVTDAILHFINVV